MARCATPAIDLSYFIFCCTDSELRERLPELLRKYHSALVRRMDELGTVNGRELFPFERLQMHMKKYARFGFGRYKRSAVERRRVSRVLCAFDRLLIPPSHTQQAWH